ncbi:MAG TPA: hypothetical protein VIM73_07880 [Polyangiaceae bacterium]
MRTTISACCLIVMLGSACSAAVDESVDEATEPVAFRASDTGLKLEPLERIDFDNGTSLAFFEPSPGGLMAVQWGPNGATPPVNRDLAAKRLKPTELYQEVAKRTAPATLMDAQVRAEALKKEASAKPRVDEARQMSVSPPVAASGALSSQPGMKREAVYYYDCQGSFSYEEWFNCSFCYGGGDYDLTWMYVTGSGSFTRTDMNHTWSTVSVYGGGSVHFNNQKRPWYSWSTTLDTYVQNGYWAQAEMGWDFTDFDTKSLVDNASGDSYHWCSYGWST